MKSDFTPAYLGIINADHSKSRIMAIRDIITGLVLLFGVTIGDPDIIDRLMAAWSSWLLVVCSFIGAWFALNLMIEFYRHLRRWTRNSGDARKDHDNDTDSI